VGALEPIALLVAGAIVKWIFDMAADRAKKADEIDKNLTSEDGKLRDKIAEIDKMNSTAIATLNSGISHVAGELAGIRSDMKDHRSVVFQRLERNEREIGEVKTLVEKTNVYVEAIQSKLSERPAP
jgi:uncharacterized protein (UPF0335 family)